MRRLSAATPGDSLTLGVLRPLSAEEQVKLRAGVRFRVATPSLAGGAGGALTLTLRQTLTLTRPNPNQAEAHARAEAEAEALALALTLTLFLTLTVGPARVPSVPTVQACEEVGRHARADGKDHQHHVSGELGLGLG